MFSYWVGSFTLEVLGAESHCLLPLLEGIVIITVI